MKTLEQYKSENNIGELINKLSTAEIVYYFLISINPIYQHISDELEKNKNLEYKLYKNLTNIGIISELFMYICIYEDDLNKKFEKKFYYRGGYINVTIGDMIPLLGKGIDEYKEYYKIDVNKEIETIFIGYFQSLIYYKGCLKCFIHKYDYVKDYLEMELKNFLIIPSRIYDIYGNYENYIPISLNIEASEKEYEKEIESKNFEDRMDNLNSYPSRNY